VVRELKTISALLERIAFCMESDLSARGYNITIKPPVVSEPESIGYVDEEEDYAREQIAAYRRLEEREAREAEESGSLSVFKDSNG
jgi:hypothetical protein